MGQPRAGDAADAGARSPCASLPPDGRARRIRETLERYGLRLEPFGGDSWLVRAVPRDGAPRGRRQLLDEILDSLSSGADADGARYAVAASIACHSSVRAGQTLTDQEMAALADALASEANPQRCPHGRPTIVRVSNESIGRQFGRT